jgi:hypothetical protein
MMKITLLFLLLLSNVRANETGLYKERRRINFFADFTYNSSTIKTEQSGSTLSATTSSTFTSAELGVDYFFKPQWAATAQALFALTTDIDAEITGFDMGLRYYPFKKGHQSEITLLKGSLETAPGWTSFMHVGFVSRSYQFSNSSLSFQGLEAGGGMDFHFTQRYFIRGSADYQMLQNTRTRTLNGIILGMAVGYAF